MILLLGISVILIHISEAYVLFQVRKQDENHSNIDGLIHKDVPSEQIGNLANLAQDHLTDKNNEKAVKNRAVDNEQNQRRSNPENVEISLDLNDKDGFIKLIDLALKRLSNGPVIRADGNKEIKPKKIQFRAGESSLLYEINTKSVVGVIKEILSSPTVRDYLDTLTKRAAVAYGSMSSNTPSNQ